MSPSPKDWFEEAALRLEDARALLDGRGRGSRALSAAYYAVHAAGKGALLAAGVEIDSHAALVRLLGYHFTRVGRLPDDTASRVQDLHERRLAADYDLEPCSAAEARALLGDAEAQVGRRDALT